jgi:TolA-binding protein
LLVAAALSLLASPTMLAQSAGAQPSTQNAGAQQSTNNEEAEALTKKIDELKQKLAGLEKEVEDLRKSVAKLEDQQKSATQKESQPPSKQASSSQPPSTQPAGAAGAQRPARRQRPISGLAKQETVNRDRETVARVDNQPLDPELVGFFNIPGTRDKLKIDGYAKLDVIMDPRPAGDPDQFITTTIPVNLTPTQKVGPEAIEPEVIGPVAR